MLPLGSRALFLTSFLCLLATVAYMFVTTDRLGLGVLLAASIGMAFLGGAALAGTGAADRFVYTGDIDPSRHRPAAPSIAPVFAAVAAGCMVGGAALGAPLYAAGAVIALVAGIAWFGSSGKEGARHSADVAKRVSDQVTTPYGLPIAATGIVLLIAVSISRTLLAVSKTASWVLVLIFATAIFLGGIILATRPKISKRTMTIAVGAAILSIAALGAVGLAKGERKFGEHEGEGKEKTEKSVSSEKSEGSVSESVAEGSTEPVSAEPVEAETEQ
jgi:hypothetical protein